MREDREFHDNPALSHYRSYFTTHKIYLGGELSSPDDELIPRLRAERRQCCRMPLPRGRRGSVCGWRRAILQGVLALVLLAAAADGTVEDDEVALARQRFLALLRPDPGASSNAELQADLARMRQARIDARSPQELRGVFGCAEAEFTSSAGCFPSGEPQLDMGQDADREEMLQKLQALHTLAMKSAVGDTAAHAASEVKAFILEALAYLAARGLREAGFDPGIDESRWLGMGALYYRSPESHVRPLTRPFGKAVEGLLGSVVLLLREDIYAHSETWDSVMGALGALTHRFAHGEWIDKSDWVNRNFFAFGMDPSMSRLLLSDRLCYVLALDADGDRNGTRAQHLNAWKRWSGRAFLEDSTVAQGFKPDGTISDGSSQVPCCTIYPTAPFLNLWSYVYVLLALWQMTHGHSVDLLPLGAVAAFLLAGTPWALSSSATDNIARSARVLREYTVGGTAPRSVGERRVWADVGVITPGQVCVSSLLVSLPSSGISPTWRDSSAASVWYFTRKYSDKTFWTSVDMSNPHYNHYGCLVEWYRVRENHAEHAMRAREQMHGLARRLTIFPYAGMAVFRPGSGSVVIARGFSSTVRNSYAGGRGSSIGAVPPANFHGKYQGSGTMLVLKDSKQVDFVASSNTMPYAGFDWYSMPGVTAPHRTPGDVQAMEMSRDSPFVGWAAEEGYFPRILPRASGASISVKYLYWALSPDAFVGGVSNKIEDGFAGAWGFRMEDMSNSRADMQEYLDETLAAYKSLFFLSGSGGTDGTDPAFVLALGSNISSAEINAGPIKTTLFQDHIGGLDRYPILIDGFEETGEYTAELPLNDIVVPVKIMDAAGQGYVVMKSASSKIKIVRSQQITLNHNSYSEEEQTFVASAAIEHESHATYEYALIPDARRDVLASFDPHSKYMVLSQDHVLHAVQCLRTQSVAMIFFRESTTSVAVRRKCRLISVSKPCSIIVLPRDDGGVERLNVSISNPDPGMLQAGQTFNDQSLGNRARVFMQKSSPQTTSISFEGEHVLVGPCSKVQAHESHAGSIVVHVGYDASRDVTVIDITTFFGISVSLELERMIRTTTSIGTSTPTSPTSTSSAAITTTSVSTSALSTPPPSTEALVETTTSAALSTPPPSTEALVETTTFDTISSSTPATTSSVSSTSPTTITSIGTSLTSPTRTSSTATMTTNVSATHLTTLALATPAPSNEVIFANPEAVIELTLQLPMKMQDFTSDVQLSFRKAVAAVSNVSEDSVVILSITEIDERRKRRLLAPSLAVRTAISVQSREAAISLADSFSVDDLNQGLQAAGLPTATVLSPPRLYVQDSPTTVAPALTTTAEDDGDRWNIFAVVVGSVSAIAVCTLLAIVICKNLIWQSPTTTKAVRTDLDISIASRDLEEGKKRGDGRLHTNQFYCTACQIRPVVSNSRDPSHCSGAYPFHCCCKCAATRGWQAWDTRACLQCRQGFAEPSPSSPHVSTIKGGDATFCQVDAQQEILIGGDATYSAGTDALQLPGHESSPVHTYAAGRVFDGDDAASWFLAASQELKGHSIDVQGGGEVKKGRILCPVALWSSASEVPRPVEAPKDPKPDQRKGRACHSPQLGMPTMLNVCPCLSCAA